MIIWEREKYQIFYKEDKDNIAKIKDVIVRNKHSKHIK